MFAASLCPEGRRPGAPLPLPGARWPGSLFSPVPWASVRIGLELFPAARTLSFGGCAVGMWRFRVGMGAAAGGGGGWPRGPGRQGGLRLPQLLCTLGLTGEMWVQGGRLAHRLSCRLISKVCCCHHTRHEIAVTVVGGPLGKCPSLPLGVTCLRGVAGYTVTRLSCPKSPSFPWNSGLSRTDPQPSWLPPGIQASGGGEGGEGQSGVHRQLQRRARGTGGVRTASVLGAGGLCLCWQRRPPGGAGGRPALVVAGTGGSPARGYVSTCAVGGRRSAVSGVSPGA